MDKWMLQADSAHQISPETGLQSILIVVESGGTGQEKMLPEFFTLRNWAPILLVPQQPAVPWTNGCRSWIQRIKRRPFRNRHNFP